ncbi:hypothetical protein [Vibrio bathopelagicus]|uniref:hypothetical protein n=1 Tax=Vibrio bathopelagicus TaxID=2777577 RepID=UPI0018643F3A|nr:hypothetical protein [Vibrio bathopelagicus]
MTYKTWIFISEETKTFFMTTHVNFEGMTVKAIQRDIPTWKRPEEHQRELNALAEASDFRFELDEVSHVDDLHDIKARYTSRGYRCLNRRIVLKKNNQHV